MPMPASIARHDYRLPRLYAELRRLEAEAAVACPVLAHDFIPDTSAGGRVRANQAKRAKVAAERRAASFARKEPQVVEASRLRKWPGTREIPFLQPPDMYSITADELDELPCLVRVYADDRVEVLQTRGQKREQGRLIDAGYRVGRIDMATGDYVPRCRDLASGQWQDVPLTGGRYEATQFVAWSAVDCRPADRPADDDLDWPDGSPKGSTFLQREPSDWHTAARRA
jgi:hypothetical protein